MTAAALLLLVSAAMLNWLVLALAPLAVVFLVGYSYTKRFTWLSHWVLGLVDGAAAAGGWAAVTASLDAPAFLLWAAVTFWITGFDLIYACQDVAFDRQAGLHSFPARFGIAASLTAARVCHALTVALLAATGVALGLAWPYWIGLAIATALLAYENSLVHPTDLSRLDIAFFNINGYISVIMFAAAWLGVALRG